MRQRAPALGPAAAAALGLMSLGTVLGGGCSQSPRAQRPPEAEWLARVGTGPAQTARTCGRGAADPIAQALCAVPTPTIRGIADLYAIVGLDSAQARMVAATTHSVGLSARLVSALNPRTFVFPNYGPLVEDNIKVTAFTRGEPFVELVGFDPAARAFNFYLLAFEPACQRTGCAPADLLTADVESDWAGWTLYADQDLEDTGLDCLSCHRPEGPGGAKRLLMRQLTGPWMHWADFRGVSGELSCEGEDGQPVTASGTITVQGLEPIQRIEGTGGRLAAIPMPELSAAASGYDFSSFQLYALAFAERFGDVPCEPGFCLMGEPHVFPSQAVLCEQLLRGASDLPDGAWSRYRAELVRRGLPAPFHRPDVLDPAAQAEAIGDFFGFLARNRDTDPFELTAGFLGADVLRAVGLVPSMEQTAPSILEQACGRCHGGTADAGLTRARFDVRDLDTIDGVRAEAIIGRMTLPRDSPELMPPRRAGELPPAIIEQLSAYLRSR